VAKWRGLWKWWWAWRSEILRGGGGRWSKAMSWHITDVTGHGAGNPGTRAEGTGSVRVGKVQPGSGPGPGIPYP
jgi:hypothetical protein